MSCFNDQLALDAANTFLQEFGECVTFEPWQDAPVEIRALVDRTPAIGIQNFKGAASYLHEVQIARSETAGRLIIVKGKDVLKYPLRVGGEIKRFVVLDILGPEDQGMWRLAVGQA